MIELSLQFRLFGIPKTLEEFLGINKNSKVKIWIEEKASNSALMPETATYYSRIVLRSIVAELRLPWVETGGYNGNFSAEGYIEKISLDAEKENSADGLETKMKKITSMLEAKGIPFETESKPKIIFGMRKYI